MLILRELKNYVFLNLLSQAGDLPFVLDLTTYKWMETLLIKTMVSRCFNDEFN